VAARIFLSDLLGDAPCERGVPGRRGG